MLLDLLIVLSGVSPVSGCSSGAYYIVAKYPASFEPAEY